MEHLISATSRALERHGGRLYPDRPGASQGDQNGTDPVPEPHGGSIGEQTTADPSHTKSPSAKTSNNDEAVRHNSAPELRESRFCWEPGSASNPQFQSILSSVLHISECSDRTSDRFMRCLREVILEALGPAAATLEDLPDLPPSLQGMDSTLHPFHRSCRALDHSARNGQEFRSSV